MLSIATIGILVLTLAIVFFVIFYQKRALEARLKQQSLEVEYQQKMLLSALESQENERQRLAGDLHDSIGAMLSTIRLSVLTIARTENLNTEGLQQTKKMIDDTIDTVRRISRDLMPSTLEKLGVSQTIQEMCDQHTAVSGIVIEFEQQGKEVHLDKSKEVMLFRIVQELVNNAIKHSKGSCIQVSLNWSDKVLVSVEDDGVGFNFEEKKGTSGGIGLFNMQNRVKMLNGSLEYEAHRTKGSKAILTIPLV
jgi:signal transduction histidine kinase